MVPRRPRQGEPSAGKRNGSPAPHLPKQIKGRNFEVPGCGGFVLTDRAENLEAYYTPDKEVVCFGDTEELVELARHYLAHEEERVAIARLGYERTLREHTYAHRFREIFQAMGLPAGVDGLIGGSQEID